MSSRSTRRRTDDLPPDDAEDVAEGLEDGELPEDLDDPGDDFEDDDDLDGAGMFDGDEQVTPEWLGEALGSAGIRDPREAVARTQLRDRVASTPIFAAADAEGAVQWLVEKRNDQTGEADWVGYAHLKISMPVFVDQFIQSMPKKGDPAAEFYFTPLDKRGAKLGAPGKPLTLNVPWDNTVLLAVRKARGNSDEVSLTGQDGVIRLLMDQRDRIDAERKEERQAREAAEARARAEREAAIEERMKHAMGLQGDLSATYQRISQVTQDGFSSVLSTQDKLALEREKREEERNRRDREREEARREREEAARKAEAAEREAQRKAEAKERADAHQAALDRIKAENDAALARVHAEVEARRLEMENKAALERARIEAEVEKAKAAAQAEQARIAADREREDRRRADEQERRDKMEQAERERRDKMDLEERRRREDEQKRRDALDMAERERQREHALSLEKMRQDALLAAKEGLERQSRDAKEHQALLVSTLKEKFGDGGSGLGVLGKILDTFGLTPSDAIEKAKSLLGTESSIGAEIVRGITDLGKEVVKRLPEPEYDEDDEDDEDDDSIDEAEEAAEAERERRARQRARQRERRMLPDTAKVDEAAAPVEKAPARKPGADTPLEAFLGKRTPDPDAPEDDDDSETDTPVIPAPPAIPLAEARAGRNAIAAMVDRLSDEPQDKWGAAVLASDDTDALLHYVGRVGLIRALDGYDIDVPAVGEVLVSLGLFEAPPMMPTDPQAGGAQ